MNRSWREPMMLTMTPDIDGKLRAAWRREQAFHHLRGLGWLLPALAGLAAAALLLDWALDLAPWRRLLLAVASLLALGWLGYHVWWRHLRPFDPARVALRVERLHPELRSLLISHVQFRAPSGHGSPRLMDATRARAEEQAGPLDFGGIVSFRELRNLLLSAAGALALFAASTFLLADFYRALFWRLATPFAGVAYPTRTRIVAATGDVAVRRGDPLELHARVEGEVPDRGVLWLRHGDGPWEKIELPSGESTFTHRLPTTRADFTYRFALGDARSPTYQVTVVPPPQLQDARVSCAFPPYLGRDPEDFPSLLLPPIPAGTRMRWRLACDRELKAAELRPVRKGASPIPLKIDPENARVAWLDLADAADLAAEAPDLAERPRALRIPYRLTWTGRAHGFTFADPTHHLLEVVPDRAPAVQVVEPRFPPGVETLPATVRKTLAVRFEARDDHGLGDAWLVYRLGDGPEGRVRLQGELRGAKVDQFRTVWEPAKSLPGLSEGQSLACWVEVSDNRAGPGGPNRGLSAPLRFALVSEQEYLRWVEGQQRRGFDRTRAAAREEERSAETVKTLIPEEDSR